MIKKFENFDKLQKEETIEKRFIVDEKNHKFQLFLGDILVSISSFSIEKPNELIDENYVGVFKLKTNKKFRKRGFMKFMLKKIFYYVKNDLKINNILLNVYKNNIIALNLYLNCGFEIHKDFSEDIDEEPYFTLIKKL